MTSTLRVTVNGNLHVLRIDNRATLLDMLRETLSLTGTKCGCNHGQCGACNILINGEGILSRLFLAVQADQR